MVRCKMRVVEVSKTASAYSQTPVDTNRVKLAAVAGEQNKTWSKWTPSGEVTLCINNPEALDQFHAGDYFFIDFTPAPATEAEETK